jgi:carbamoyl-phosphate synthase large subunit
MLNILVSGSSGIVGYGILRSLKEQKNNYRLIGTTIHDDSPALLFCDIFEKAISTEDPNYFQWLVKIIKKHSINLLIPSIECDMLAWNKNRDLLEKCGVLLLLNNFELIEICQDKWKFYNKLNEVYPEIAIPTCLSIDEIYFDYPVILKPRIGYGSKGIVRLMNKSEIEAYRDRIGFDLMIQPIIGDNDHEYTVSAFFDKNSNLIDYLPLKRKLSADGFTQVAEVVELNFDDILSKLAFHFKPIGPTNFQFRLESGCFKLLEINPRISSATSIRAKLGYNESVMSIDYFLNNILPTKINRAKILNKRAIRYTEELIIK